MPRLARKIALVTGAARGIGAAIAAAYVAEGATVVLTDVRDAEGRAAAAALGPAARYRRLDVRREADWDDAAAYVHGAFGRLDVLVNNPGITGFEDGPAPHDPERAALDDWRAVLATNLDGVFLGCRMALRTMGAAGSVVNVASRSGLVGVPGAAAYAASKAAVLNHTRTVALHAAAEGRAVRCNAIAPAAVLTPMWAPMLGPDDEGRADRLAALVADVPLGRFGTPKEVAALAVYLAADESAYATGATFHLDGGVLAGTAPPPGRPRS